MWGSKKLRGSVSTRIGVFVTGMKTKYAVDTGLQDTIVPISTAQINALAPRLVASVYVSHDNRHPYPALPRELTTLITGEGRRTLPSYLANIY